MVAASQESVLKRLKRIEGQVRGVAKMVEEDRYCVDILHQIEAIRGALGRVEDELLKAHTRHCVGDAFKAGSAAEQQAKITELVELIGRFKR